MCTQRQKTASDYAKEELHRPVMKVFREWKKLHPVVPAWERPPPPKLAQPDAPPPPKPPHAAAVASSLFGSDGVDDSR